VIDYKGPPPDLTLSGAAAANYFTRRYFRTLRWGAEGILWHHLHQEAEALYAEGKFAQYLDRATATETALKASGSPRFRGK
jgi:hypothetical protein